MIPTTTRLFTSLLWCLWMLMAQPLFAQQQHTISGYIADSLTHEKLIGANIYERHTSIGTTSNDYGFYSLSLAVTDSVEICISYLGYTTQCQALDLQNATQNISFYLAPNDALLQEVAVTDRKLEAQPTHQQTQLSCIDLPIAQIKSLPQFFGETDVLKALQLLPGVQSGAEGSSSLYVRGGGPDQNLILLDGVTVYNASHLFGFFSIFNADAVNHLSLIKGGFPARYGGRLSSVVDVHLKEGNFKEHHVDFSIGLLASKLLVEGPLKKNKSSFSVSARRTYLDAISRPIINLGSDGKADLGYYFQDFSFKFNHKINANNRFYISAYWSRDDFLLVDSYSSNPFSTYQDSHDSSLGWNTLIASVRWNHIFTPKLFSNWSFNLSHYDNHTFFSVENSINTAITGVVAQWETQKGSNRFDTNIQDINIKGDIDYFPNSRHRIKAGVGFTHHRFLPGATQVTYEDASFNLDTTYQNKVVHTQEMNAYIEDEMGLGGNINMNVGLRWSGWIEGKKMYNFAEPRFSARWLFADNASLKWSYAYMVQYLHLLSNSSAFALPNDIWVPATESVKPQSSHQVAVGLSWLWNKQYEISVEGYYKRLNNVIDYIDGASFLDAKTGWEEKVAAGKGEAYGIEFFVHKKIGKLNGWLGYTLAWSNRQIADINYGESYPYKYDRRHDLSLSLIYQLSKGIELSGNWVYGTGNAYSLSSGSLPTVYLPSDGKEELAEEVAQYFAHRNSYRMPSYHRLDISCSFIKQKKKGERRWNIGVYNAYNRQNPFFILLRKKGRTMAYKLVSLLPILPSISYSRKF